MTRIYFDEVAVIAIKYWTENGRKRKKTKKFSQTINPFNKNAAGLPKSRAEIITEIMAERRAWLASDDKA